MIRNFKVLGLAVVAALALTAVVASAASAAEFHAESAPVNISGSQTTTHVFTTDPGTVTCKTATFSGSQSTTTSSQQTITPTYESCTLATIFGNIAVTVNFNGCDYLFTASGEVHINCPAGKNVVVSGPGCTVTVPPQTLKEAITYTHAGSGTTTDITEHANAKGISYSYSGFTCGSGTNTTNGTYTGTATTQAFDPISGAHRATRWTP